MVKMKKQNELNIALPKSAPCDSFWGLFRTLLCSVMFTLGFNLLLFSVFVSLNASPIAVTAIEAAFICALTFLLRKKGVGLGENIVTSVCCAALFVFFVIFFGSIRSGLSALTNDWITLLIRLTGKIHLKVQAEAADKVPLLILLGGITAMIAVKLFFTQRRIAAYVLILLGALLAASGVAPSSLGAALIILSGVLFIALGSIAPAHIRIRSARVANAVIPLLLAAAAALAALPLRSLYPDQKLNALNSGLKLWLHGIAYDESTNSMPEGRLSPLPARNASDAPAIAITSETVQSGYYRGMTGEVYTGTTWEPLSGARLAEYNDLFYWLHSDGFFAQTQMSAAAAAAQTNGAGSDSAEAETEINIELISACSKYLYLPYNAVGNDLLDGECIGDSACIRQADTGRTYTVGCSPVRSAPRLRRMLKDADGDSVREYLADERAYAQLVHETSLQLTPEAAAAMAEIFGENPPALTLAEILPLISNALKDNITYDETVKTNCGANDFAAYVLTVGKRGYSVHYAACAAVMLRYFGVPSRYVEGYYIDAETAAERDVAGRVVLTEENAHAWAEYYLDGVGWIPFETTPGFEGADSAFSGSETRADDPSEDPDNADSPDDPNSADNPDDTYRNDNLPDIRLARPQKDLSKLNKTKLASALILSLLLLLLALFAAAVVLLAVRRARFKRAFNAMLDAEPNEAIAAMFGYLSMFMSACGRDIAEIDAQFFELNDEAVFSNHCMTAEQKAAMQAFVESTVDEYRRSRTFLERLRDRYIACIYI